MTVGKTGVLLLKGHSVRQPEGRTFPERGAKSHREQRSRGTHCHPSSILSSGQGPCCPLTDSVPKVWLSGGSWLSFPLLCRSFLWKFSPKLCSVRSGGEGVHVVAAGVCSDCCQMDGKCF